MLTDIHMPDMDGIELARHLLKLPHPPVVIFTTAFHEHAVQAFEVNAIDYLMKPVRVQRLLGALQKVPRLKPVAAEKLAQLPASARRFLSVTERSRVVLVPLDEIVYLKAELKYITIRTAQREYLLEESLTKLESEFGVALRARASQLPRRARLHPRLRAPRQRRRRLALGSAADRRAGIAAGFAPPAIRRARRGARNGRLNCQSRVARLTPRPGRIGASAGSRGFARSSRFPSLRSPRSPRSPLPPVMRTLVCGSLAYDTIMVFPDHFSRHILPEQAHVLSVSFQIGEMRREWGGCAGNIAYNLKHIGGEPVVMATIGDDGVDYRERLDAFGIGIDGVRHVPGRVHGAGVHHHRPRRQPDHGVSSGRDELSRTRAASSDVRDIGLGIVAPDGKEGMRSHAEQFAQRGHPVHVRSRARACRCSADPSCSR